MLKIECATHYIPDTKAYIPFWVRGFTLGLDGTTSTTFSILMPKDPSS
jgi:hypothetical protein